MKTIKWPDIQAIEREEKAARHFARGMNFYKLFWVFFIGCFLGVVVVTERHTPRFCGLLSRMGLSDLNTGFSRPFLISWLIVGIITLPPFSSFAPPK